MDDDDHRSLARRLGCESIRAGKKSPPPVGSLSEIMLCTSTTATPFNTR